MVTKTVRFNKTGAAKLPNDKPVVYKIQTPTGKTNYVGIAKRGRVQDRIQEHLDKGEIPGVRVHIEQVHPSEMHRRKSKTSFPGPNPSTTNRNDTGARRFVYFSISGVAYLMPLKGNNIRFP